MKLKSLFTFLFLATVSMAIGQNQDLDKKIDESIDQMAEKLDSLDLNKFISETIFGEIEKLKPTEEKVEEMEKMLKSALSSIKNIDFTVFEEVAKELEKAVEELEFPDKNTPADKKSEKTKGKRI